ncbi:MAG TPA: hypothetical protein VF927_09250 [Solirubrobacteraceae bacterium]
MGQRVRAFALAFVAVCAGSVVGGVATAAAKGSGPPHNSVAPAISGTAIEHKRLKVTHGTWTGATPFVYTVSWSRCDSSGGECNTIPSAAKSNYQAVPADVGHRLIATVKATNGEGAAEASSAPSALVAAVAPKHKGNPPLSGEFVDGHVVTVGNGTWKGTPPFIYSYEWVRCGHDGCHEIAGAHEQSYRLQSADIGKKIRSIVTATNTVGSGTVKSKQSATNIVPGPPVNTAQPTISGTVAPGQTLTANNGTWVGTTPIEYTYQWLTCAPLGGGCSEIAGATQQTHEVGVGDIGQSFEVTVTAKNVVGEASATSPETSATEGTVQPPENVLAPTITGLAVTGQTVHATEGVWNGTEPTFAYQWELCNSSGGACAEITGAQSQEFTIPDGDAGHTLRVTVTAGNAAGSAAKTSEPSSEIVGVGPANTELPTVSGTPTAGQLLTASSGKWSGTEPITFEYEWLRCNTTGTGCTQAAAPSVLPTYSVAGADVGHKLRVNVIAKNIAGTGAAESEPTALVAGVLPSNVLAPIVTGLAVTGQTLTATEGTWTGNEPITYSFRWQLCTKAGTGCGDISGATKSTYVIADEDATHTLRVIVTAKNVAGSTEKESATTIEVLGLAPKNTELPTVSGTATAGQILTAASGKWSGTEPITFEYEWLRCNTGGTGCTQAAAPSVLPTYSVVAADVGHTLRANVIATNIAGKGEKESAPTATVGGVKPSNTIAPTALGLAVTGQTLTATEGTWTGTEPITYAFRWQQCSKAGTECGDISGETKSTYLIKDADAGHTLRVVVTAKNVAGSTEKESATTSEVLGVAPKNTEAPAVSGEAKEGQLLTASSGKWSGTEPITFEYEWLRCNAAGESCVQAAGKSILATYSVVAADVGKTLRAKVYAKNIAGTGEKESAATATVKGVVPTNTVLPLIVGTATSGATVEATEGTWTGTQPITYEVEWKLCVSATSCKVEQSGPFATAKKFKIPSGSSGKKLRLNVIATNAAGQGEKEALEISILL